MGEIVCNRNSSEFTENLKTAVNAAEFVQSGSDSFGGNAHPVCNSRRSKCVQDIVSSGNAQLCLAQRFTVLENSKVLACFLLIAHICG